MESFSNSLLYAMQETFSVFSQHLLVDLLWGGMFFSV